MLNGKPASENELARLEAIAQDYYGAGVAGMSVDYSFKIFRRYLRTGPILEMGPAQGIMTDLLVSLDEHLTVVEGSALFCDEIKARHPSVEVENSLFEDFSPRRKFQNILMGHVLEHVENPTATLKLAASWLGPSGRVMAAVPNSRSLHRQAAVSMGLLPFEEALNEADRCHGHRRVYNPETFRNTFIEAGYSIEIFGGYWLKPLSNNQIEKTWTPQMLSAFMQIGERYPDIAAEIYIVATPH